MEGETEAQEQLEAVEDVQRQHLVAAAKRVFPYFFRPDSKGRSKSGAGDAGGTWTQLGTVLAGPCAISLARLQGNRVVEASDFVMEESKFMVLDIQQHWGSEFARAAAAGGSGGTAVGGVKKKAGCICPKCKQWGLQSKGPVWETVIITGTTDGWFFTVPCRMECKACPGNGGKTISFTTTSDELMQALDEAGLGHLPDSLPIAYTKRGSYDKTILRLARAIYEGGSIAAQATAVHLREQLEARRLQVQDRYLKYAVGRRRGSNLLPTEIARIKQQALDVCKLKFSLPSLSNTYLRTIVLKGQDDRLNYKMASLASIDAGPDAAVSADHTFSVMKKLTVDGGKPYAAVFTVLNSRAEVVLQVCTQSSSMEEVRDRLQCVKDNIAKTGGTQPKYWWVDWPQGMERVIKEVWPDAKVYQDLFHIYKRYGDAVPDGHSAKDALMEEVRECYQLPFRGKWSFTVDGKTREYDGERLLAEYRKLHGLSPGAPIPHASPAFRAWWKSKKGIWSHPDRIKGVALLNRFWTKWTSQKSTYCARAGELMVDKLTTVHQNTLALVAAGYLEDPLATPQMYFMDSRGMPRPIRGSSGLENMNKHLHEAVPGTRMGEAGMHRAITHFAFKQTAKQRPITRPDDFPQYPSDDHQLMHSINEKAAQAGVPSDQLPYPRITQPKAGITVEDYAGGLQPHGAMRMPAGIASSLQQLQQSRLQRGEVIRSFNNKLAAMHASAAREGNTGNVARARQLLSQAFDLQAALRLFEGDAGQLQKAYAQEVDQQRPPEALAEQQAAEAAAQPPEAPQQQQPPEAVAAQQAAEAPAQQQPPEVVAAQQAAEPQAQQQPPEVVAAQQAAEAPAQHCWQPSPSMLTSAPVTQAGEDAQAGPLVSQQPASTVHATAPEVSGSLSRPQRKRKAPSNLQQFEVELADPVHPATASSPRRKMRPPPAASSAPPAARHKPQAMSPSPPRLESEEDRVLLLELVAPSARPPTTNAEWDALAEQWNTTFFKRLVGSTQTQLRRTNGKLLREAWLDLGQREAAHNTLHPAAAAERAAVVLLQQEQRQQRRQQQQQQQQQQQHAAQPLAPPVQPGSQLGEQQEQRQASQRHGAAGGAPPTLAVAPKRRRGEQGGAGTKHLCRACRYKGSLVFMTGLHKLICPHKAEWDALPDSQQRAWSKKWSAEDKSNGHLARQNALPASAAAAVAAAAGVTAAHAAPALPTGAPTAAVATAVVAAPAAAAPQGLAGWARFPGFTLITRSTSPLPQQQQPPQGQQQQQQEGQGQQQHSAAPATTEQQPSSSDAFFDL